MGGLIIFLRRQSKLFSRVIGNRGTTDTPSCKVKITMGILLYIAVTAVIALIILWLGLAIAFFIAGRIVSGVNTTFGEALLVAFLGAIINTILHAIFEYVFIYIIVLPAPLAPYASIIGFVISSFITLIVYLPLFKRFFDVSWGGALIVGIIAFIFMIVMGIISAILIVILAILLLPLLLLPGP
jgi:hypothetical protein